MPVAELHYVDQEIWCRTPYDAEFINELKDSIPFPHRRWNPAERVWIIDTLFEHELLDLCDRFFDDVRSNRDQPKNQHTGATVYASLFLTPDAPMPVVEAAYRALAKLWHPDISDDARASEQMKQINMSYQRIKQERS